MTMAMVSHDDPLPRWYELTVVAQDPSVMAERDGQQRILTSRVRVPADWLEPGPRTHRFHVVEYDQTTHTFSPPLALHASEWPGMTPEEQRKAHWTAIDPFEHADDATLTGPGFRAQNAFAIAARTLSLFEAGLGRRVPWGFGNHPIYLVPHAMRMRNAYYSREDECIVFGYFEQDGQVVDTCLSHDIIAHETSHAVLDGLRPRLLEPGLPDQAAFHEGFADAVALLSVFSMPEVVRAALEEQQPAPSRAQVKNLLNEEDARAFDLEHSMLFSLAEQWGSASEGRSRGLRTSVTIEPRTGILEEPEYLEPHRRGEVLVAAIMQTLSRIWRERVEKLSGGERALPAIAAEEGAKSAAHLLNMLIRALDYTPPGEFEFGDFLDAIIVSDTEVAPDDAHDYRGSLREAFGGFGIYQPPGARERLTEAAYDNLNFSALRTDPEEVYRFLWQNAGLLKLNRDLYTRIDRVSPSVRVGPDGFVVAETVATYVQDLEGTVAELSEMSGGRLKAPASYKDDDRIRIGGAGVLIFDQFGKAKYHQHKKIDEWERQTRRLASLSASLTVSAAERRGYVDGESARFGHMPAVLERREW